jgi:hypothetical protein
MLLGPAWLEIPLVPWPLDGACDTSWAPFIASVAVRKLDQVASKGFSFW